MAESNHQSPLLNVQTRYTCTVGQINKNPDVNTGPLACLFAPSQRSLPRFWESGWNYSEGQINRNNLIINISLLPVREIKKKKEWKPLKNEEFATKRIKIGQAI